MMRTTRRNRHPQLRARPGQALVEFALLAPILLLIVLGIVQFGRAWNAYQVITDAAREGARTAVVADPTITSDSVMRRINDALWRAGFDSANAQKTLTGFRSGRGLPATVAIAYPYRLGWIEPFMNWTPADASITLRTSVVMRNE